VKIKTTQEYLDYIFPIYMEFGTYSIQDKSSVEAFEFGIKSLDDVKLIARIIVDAANEGHDHLEAYDIAWPTRSVGNEASQLLLNLWEEGEEAFDVFCDEITEICSVISNKRFAEDIMCNLTEV